MERFAIRSFSLIEVFADILLRCLGQKYSLCNIIKERGLYSWKNFRDALENRETCKSLAQRIFPRLPYVFATYSLKLYRTKIIVYFMICVTALKILSLKIAHMYLAMSGR